MKITKKSLLTLCLCMMAGIAMAVPARRACRTITLGDGRQVQAVLCGDENVHFYQDAQGNAYTLQADGTYARQDRRQLVSRWSERLQARNRHRIARAQQRGMLQTAADPRSATMHRVKWGAEQNPVSGSKKGLVILVNFSDKSMSAIHTQSFYNGYFNQKGFSLEGAKGSVHDYFIESSYGQFDLTFDVIGPVTVSKPLSYYGTNDMYGADSYPATMVSEACRLAKEQGVDFSTYDWDNDGFVDQVFLVYAGYGENMDAPSNTIWPHESTLSDSKLFGDGNGAIKFDGVTVDTYAVSCELFGNSGTVPAGIGTACHEFSHCMGIPDMYDTNGVNLGMDAWDIMDYGSYNGEYFGDSPSPYTAYERMYCGWLTPTVLDTPCRIQGMKALCDSPEAYIIYNEKNRHEYYLLENRQQKGFGSADPAHGMLVVHVDFDSQAWIDNTVNSATPQRMTIMAADNKWTHETSSGDTYPGKTRNTALTDVSTPAATLNTPNADGRKFMGHPIEEISEADGLISFAFDGGEAIDAPLATAATGLLPDAFTANWTPVTGVEDYDLMLTSADNGLNRHPISDFYLMHEDFSGFNNGTEKNGTVDVSNVLDLYTQAPGWEGQCIFTTPRNEIRIGTSMVGKIQGGYIISPWLPTKTHVVSVSFTVRSYSSDTEPLYLVMGEGEEGGPVGKITLTKENEQYVVTASTDTDEWWFGLSCDARCYVSEMTAYEGHITAEDLEAGYLEAETTKSEVIRVQGTSHTFTDLPSGKLFSYKVRAVKGSARSAWSNDIDVTLPTAIQSVTLDTPNAPATYDLQGRAIQGNPAKGIYITRGRKVVR